MGYFEYVCVSAQFSVNHIHIILCSAPFLICILCSLGHRTMNDRRGHRKLRLCSNKYYEKRKYFPKMLLVSIPRRTISVLKVSIPMDMLPFRVSLPLSVYKELAVPSLEVLHGRVQRLDTLDEGMNLTSCYTFLVSLFRVESYDAPRYPEPLSDCFY